MKIYDCFMYYDEDELLDLRLNILDKYVDKFLQKFQKICLELHSNDKGEGRRNDLLTLQKYTIQFQIDFSTIR